MCAHRNARTLKAASFQAASPYSARCAVQAANGTSTAQPTNHCLQKPPDNGSIIVMSRVLPQLMHQNDKHKWSRSHINTGCNAPTMNTIQRLEGQIRAEKCQMTIHQCQMTIHQCQMTKVSDDNPQVSDEIHQQPPRQLAIPT
jgi:hypothetical protein